MVDRRADSIGGGGPRRAWSMVCDAACAAAGFPAAARPCARRPPAVRGNRAARSACLATRRPRAARRNATARRLPPRPAMRAIGGLRQRMPRANGRRRIRPTQRALLQARVPAGRAPTLSPGRTRPPAHPRVNASFCAGASLGPLASERHHPPAVIDLSSPIPIRSLDALAAISSYSCRRCSTRAPRPTGGTTMTRATLITTLAALAIITGAGGVAWSQETLKVAIPQRGAWDAGVAELGQRGGIFKKHGLDLEILYVQ